MMNATITQHSWTPFLKLFSEQNNSRPTRLGVFEGSPGEMTDYWIEDGLPLAGISADVQGENLTIEIMLGDKADAKMHHLTHTVKGARLMKVILSADGAADGLEIKGAEGKTTILRFEK
jgi:hypothetical protein